MIWGERLSWRLARTRARLVVPEVYDHLRKRRNIMVQNAGTLKANNSYYQKDLPLESGIQQALSKCTRGAFPVLFQLHPKATRQPAPPVPRVQVLEASVQPQDCGEGAGRGPRPRSTALGRGQPRREGPQHRPTPALPGQNAASPCV